MRARLIAIGVFILATAGWASAFAQGPAARVTGSVLDVNTGGALAGVHVRLVAVESAVAGNAESRATAVGVPAARFEAVTDPMGGFSLDGVPPGRYHLIVVLDGFQPFTDPRELAVSGESEMPPVVVGYTLRMAAEAQADARVEAAHPQDTAAGSAMNVIPGEAVVVAPGALEDVMRTFQARPGVAASQDDRNDMLVRGGGAIENATRIDGFDVPNPSHFGTPGSSGGAFSIVAPWLIDRAVLRAGGFSVEFGERASSVLDLTLKPVGRDRVHGQAGASVGGAMVEAESAFAAGRGSWLVSARRSFLDVTFARGGDRAAPHYGDVMGRLEYAFAGAHRVEMLVIDSSDDVVVTSTGTNAINDRQSVTIAGLSLRSQWTPRTSTALVASYGRTRVDAVVGNAVTADGSDRSTEVELRARAELRRRVGRDAELMAGAALKHPDLRFDLAAKGFRNSFGFYVAPLHANFPYSFTDASAYADARLPALAGVRLTPGVRVDRGGTAGRFDVSPRVSGEYPLTGRVRLMGAYGVYRQTLPYVWIGSNVNNGRLEPVISRQALAGVSISLPERTAIVIEAFDKRYAGYPVDYATEPWHVLLDAAADYESPFVGQLAPDGRVHARGLDASVRHPFANGLAIDGSYSYWRVGQFSAYGNGYRPWQQWLRADYDIRHQARLQLAYQTAGRWRFAALFRYASGRPYTPYDAAVSISAHTGRMAVSEFNSATCPPYHRLDVRVDRTIAVGRTRLVVYGEIDNVYDRDNLYAYEWSGAARQARPIYQWGRLPVAGVRWEF